MGLSIYSRSRLPHRNQGSGKHSAHRHFLAGGGLFWQAGDVGRAAQAAVNPEAEAEAVEPEGWVAGFEPGLRSHQPARKPPPQTPGDH